MATKPLPRPQVERARAAARLAKDGELRPVAMLTAVAGATTQSVARWITDGKVVRGTRVYLDGILDPYRGFCSSIEAVQRFHRECDALKSSSASSSTPAPAPT